MSRLPVWLRRSFPEGGSTLATTDIIQDLNLNTICESAKCPNKTECFSRKTATFLILGNLCTRRCTFCSVPQGFPKGTDDDEADRVAEAAFRLGLRHVVITSSTRDDLKDGGANVFFDTVQSVRHRLPESTIEVLTPDFKGHEKPILRVAEALPNVYNHNLETVPRLYRVVRPGAIYSRSLRFFETIKKKYPEMMTKSGLMLGLGETEAEVMEVVRDLRQSGCDILTLGQYLKPEDGKLDVVEYIEPAQFQRYEKLARAVGFKEVFAGPFIRSSYHAGETFLNAQTSALSHILL